MKDQAKLDYIRKKIDKLIATIEAKRKLSAEAPTHQVIKQT
jgi:hypothetical protein